MTDRRKFKTRHTSRVLGVKPLAAAEGSDLAPIAVAIVQLNCCGLVIRDIEIFAGDGGFYAALPDTCRWPRQQTQDWSAEVIAMIAKHFPGLLPAAQAA